MESFKPAELVPLVLVEGKKHGPREKPSQRPDMPFKGDPDFSEEDFKRVWDMVRHNEEEDMQHVSFAEVKTIYNEIVHLRFNANNFCLPIPDEDLTS